MSFPMCCCLEADASQGPVKMEESPSTSQGWSYGDWPCCTRVEFLPPGVGERPWLWLFESPWRSCESLLCLDFQWRDERCTWTLRTWVAPFFSRKTPCFDQNFDNLIIWSCWRHRVRTFNVHWGALSQASVLVVFGSLETLPCVKRGAWDRQAGRWDVCSDAAAAPICSSEEGLNSLNSLMNSILMLFTDGSNLPLIRLRACSSLFVFATVQKQVIDFISSFTSVLVEGGWLVLEPLTQVFGAGQTPPGTFLWQCLNLGQKKPQAVRVVYHLVKNK